MAAISQIRNGAAQVTRGVGKKQVFLPNFTLTFIRTPSSPPTTASFIVPLNLNKLDLRDYLLHGYGVRVKSVRSYILQQKLSQDKPNAKRPSPRKWFRPRSIKKMMVEMDSPFVWPEEVTDFEKWDKKTHTAAHEQRDEQEAAFRPDYREKPTRERESIATQAKALLNRQVRWKDLEENVQNEEWTEVEEEQVVPEVER